MWVETKAHHLPTFPRLRCQVVLIRNMASTRAAGHPLGPCCFPCKRGDNSPGGESDVLAPPLPSACLSIRWNGEQTVFLSTGLTVQDEPVLPGAGADEERNTELDMEIRGKKHSLMGFCTFLQHCLGTTTWPRSLSHLRPLLKAPVYISCWIGNWPNPQSLKFFTHINVPFISFILLPYQTSVKQHLCECFTALLMWNWLNLFDPPLKPLLL